MTRLGLTLGMAMAVSPTWAHDLSGIASAWTYDPWVFGTLYLTAGLYLVGTRRMWWRVGWGRGVALGQSAAFWSGWTILTLALLSPLHWLGERLFTAHMIEHAIIIAIAAPLLALARPTVPLLWALPHAARIVMGRLMRFPSAICAWITTRPLVATALHGMAVWMWHMPRFYELAVSNLLVHRLQHLSFVVSALLFWWAVLGPRREGPGMLCLFISLMHTGLLGLTLTTSTRVLYPYQTKFSDQFGLTPLEDQQLAGLVMWVPMGVIYTIGGLLLAALWISRSSLR